MGIYKESTTRKVFRMTSFLLHVTISALGLFFYNHDLATIKRSDVVKHDWKYIEFIERIFNNNEQQGEYTLEMLGTEAVFNKGFDASKTYFDSKKSANAIFQSTLGDPDATIVKSFFDDISKLINGAKFASPLYLYKKNAQIYGLPGKLCTSDTVGISNVEERNAIIASKAPESMSTLVRFCKPNIAPSVDYAYCFSAITKHQFIMLILAICSGVLALWMPVFYGFMHSTKRGGKVHPDDIHSHDEHAHGNHTIQMFANFFHRLEDLLTFLDFSALVAFGMEVVDGFPSGFPQTRCPHTATGLYDVYMMFNTVFVFLCVLTFISALSWILDSSVRSPSYNGTLWVYWHTRSDELTKTAFDKNTHPDIHKARLLRSKKQHDESLLDGSDDED